MFGLMRKLISKPFADNPEKRDHMDKLVCNMVDGIPMQPTETIYLDSVIGPKTAKGTINYGDWPPIDYIGVEKPVWRPHNGRDLPKNAVEVFEFGKVAQVVGVYQGWHSVKYRENGHIFDTRDSAVEFVFFGEYAKRVECQECWGGGKEIQTRTSTFSDYGWVGVSTKYTGAKCRDCKGKGYTLERFKR